MILYILLALIAVGLLLLSKEGKAILRFIYYILAFVGFGYLLFWLVILIIVTISSGALTHIASYLKQLIDKIAEIIAIPFLVFLAVYGAYLLWINRKQVPGKLKSYYLLEIRPAKYLLLGIEIIIVSFACIFSGADRITSLIATLLSIAIFLYIFRSLDKKHKNELDKVRESDKNKKLANKLEKKTVKEKMHMLLVGILIVIPITFAALTLIAFFYFLYGYYSGHPIF